jgi:hypothetical protein
MKSHTGGDMSLSRGVIYETSKRQKLNMKSSVKSELVGINDVMPQIMWTLYFLESQGYKIDDNVLNKDSGKRTRHIAVRYFFIVDQVKLKNMHRVLFHR